MLKTGERVVYQIKHLEVNCYEGEIMAIDDIFIKFKAIRRCYEDHDFDLDEIEYMVVPLINILQISKMR